MREHVKDFLKERYYRKGEENWSDLSMRVADALANDDTERREFYDMIVNMRGLPSSPVLMNAGSGGYLSACSYVPMEDSMQSIMTALFAMVQIQKDGGGTGFNFSKLREKGAPISSGGTSSGPIAFMEGINHWSIAVKQGGKRRGANMAIMSMNHPDIVEFINIKSDLNRLRAFNLSVQVDGRIFYDTKIDTVSPLTNTMINETRTNNLLFLIASNIHDTGEPGVLFWDNINMMCRTPWLGRLEGINPCGEIPLYSWESCCLGSINLYEHVINGRIDYRMLERTTKTMVQLLNRVLDKNNYPLFQMREAALKTRKIGIGIMGFADMLLALDVVYGSEACMSLIDHIGITIRNAAEEASKELALADGPYPAWKEGYPRLRNAQFLAIAPTGSISIIADVSSGIEPNPYWKYTINRDDNTPYHITNRYLRDFGMTDITNFGDFKHLVTAFDIPPKIHIDVQARWQMYIDQSISKTINLPKETSVNEIMDLIRYAYEQGCKGITMFRSGCRRDAFLRPEEVCVECDTGVCNIQEK
jgi:ribonucleoside-diphosphate reductase alpha chain